MAEDPGRAGLGPARVRPAQQVLLTLIAGMAPLVLSILMIHPPCRVSNPRVPEYYPVLSLNKETLRQI